jgi:hypothetical protein
MITRTSTWFFVNLLQTLRHLGDAVALVGNVLHTFRLELLEAVQQFQVVFIYILSEEIAKH